MERETPFVPGLEPVEATWLRMGVRAPGSSDAWAAETSDCSARTVLRITTACALSSSEAAADSSAPAALDWVALSIWATAVVTWEMPSVCSLEPVEISPTSSSTLRALMTISSKLCATFALIRTPCSLRLTESSIFTAVSFADCAERCARDRTSSATTAKPAPASPARAASTAAFRARMLVWKAISSIVFTIFAMLADESLMPSMACFISDMLPAPASAAWRVWLERFFAFAADSALRLVMLNISSSEALVSSMEAACSLAPEAIDWLDVETSCAAAAVCSAPCPSCSARLKSVRLVPPITARPTAAPMTSAARVTPITT